MDQGRARALISPALTFRTLALAAAVAVIVPLGCATGGAADEGASASGPVGAPLPPLTVETMSGKPIKVSAYRGRVLLLDVWATWCAPCQQELPILDQMAGRLKRQGVDVLAVSVDQERANVEKFLRSHSHRSLTVAHDPRGEIAELLQPEKMPTSYVVDRAGIVRYVNAGFVPEDAPSIEKRLLEVASQ